MRIKRIGDHVLPIPSRATPGAAGYDLCARGDHHILPGESAAIPTGFAWEIDVTTATEVREGLAERGIDAQQFQQAFPTVQFGFQRDRSGLAKTTGLTVVAGVVDGDARGEVHVQVRNLGDDPVHIEHGQRIGQMAILVALTEPLVEVEPEQELSATERGGAGFGSSGA